MRKLELIVARLSREPYLVESRDRRKGFPYLRAARSRLIPSSGEISATPRRIRRAAGGPRSIRSCATPRGTLLCSAVAAAGGSAERDEAAALTGAYLATIGEGKEVRGRIGRAEPLLPRFMTNVAAPCRFSEG